MKAINRGFFLSAAISAGAVFVLSQIYLDDGASRRRRSGSASSSRARSRSSRNTSRTRSTSRSRRSPSRRSTGPATTILSGFSIGLESTVWSVLIIAGAVMGSFYLGDNTR